MKTEQELNERAEVFNAEMVALDERIGTLAKESKRLADKVDTVVNAVMDTCGESGEIPQSVMARAAMSDNAARALRNLADEIEYLKRCTRNAMLEAKERKK